MSVTKVWTKYASPVAEERDGAREYTVVLGVKTNSAADGPKTVLSDARIPKIGAAYVYNNESDGGALCNRRNPQKIGNYLRDGAVAGSIWEVTCTYAPPGGGGGGGDQGELPPMERVAEVHWGVITQEITLPADVNDKAYVNSAGTPFDPVPPHEEFVLTCTISRNELTYSPMVAGIYMGTINPQQFARWPRRHVKLASIRADEGFEASWGAAAYYWIVTYELHFRIRQSWLIQEVNRGPKARPEIGEEATYSAAAAGDDPESTGEVYLDDDGLKLSEEDIKEGRLSYSWFQNHAEVDWSALQLEPIVLRCLKPRIYVKG